MGKGNCSGISGFAVNRDFTVLQNTQSLNLSTFHGVGMFVLKSPYILPLLFPVLGCHVVVYKQVRRAFSAVNLQGGIRIETRNGQGYTLN